MGTSKKIFYLLFILLILSVITPYEAVSGNKDVAFTIAKVDDNGLIEIRITNHTGEYKYFVDSFLYDGNCIRFEIKDESGNRVYYQGPQYSLPWSEENIIRMRNNEFFGQIISLTPPFFNLEDSVKYTIKASYSTLHLRDEFEKDVWIGILDSNEIIMNYKNLSP